MIALFWWACAGIDPAVGPLPLAPVQVHVDGAGISHIQADNDHDLFFAQGYVCAGDRIFQMDLLRRRAWGRRAEVLGEERFESDLQSRALRFGAWAEATAQALPSQSPDFHAALVAYTAGVNAWLADAELGRNGASLPPQFAALGYAPEPWRVEDSLAIEKLIAAGLSMRPDQDVILGLLDLLLGPELFSDLYWYRAFDPEYIVPDFYAGMDTSAARSPLPARPRPRPTLDLSPAQATALLRGVATWRMDLGGSNNQAVAGGRTDSGHALFASDSHQGLGHPAVYWLVHLSTTQEGGDLDVVGATFPGVPMVLFGHNGRIAWGPTTSIYDVADAWLEVYDGNDEDAVLFEGQAVPLQKETVAIGVRDEVREVELATVPHHGPMMPAEAMGLPVPLAVSLAWNGYQARSIGPSFLEMMRADDVDAFRDAMAGYYTGGQHFLVADAQGRIAYDSTTELPIRQQIDPDNPPVTLLPGQGGYEWLAAGQGGDPAGPAPFATVPRALVPHVVDPPSGILATANNDPVGQTDDNAPFDAPVYISGVYDIGTRALRPRQALEEIAATRPITFEDLVQVQLDTSSRLAERLVPFLLLAAERRPDLVQGDVATALSLLEAWDLRCEVDQAAPTLFHAWLIRFAAQVLQDEGDLISSVLLDELDSKIGLVLSKFVVRWLEGTAADIDAIERGEVDFPSASGRNFFDDRTTEALETRDEVILGALAAAIEELRPILEALGADGADLSTWTWGRVHVLYLEDPALAEASSAVLPKPGGLYTVDVGDFDWLQDGALPDRWTVTNAPSNRFVFELDPDGFQTWMALPGGQSERPDSPFHNSLLEDYLAGAYALVPTAPDQVAAQAVETRTLRAAGGRLVVR